MPLSPPSWAVLATWRHRFPCLASIVARGAPLLTVLTLLCPEHTLAATPTPSPRPRRILYNLDGDSCLTRKAGRLGPGPITTADLTQLVRELTAPGSQVDTLLICVNAQVMYYPTSVGTLRGTHSTPEERARWSDGERQRFANLQAFLDAGIDPYAHLFQEARARGLETLLTFRINDDHGNDFLRTDFRTRHPEFQLGQGALDFSHDAVRDHVFQLLAEAARRYDCDGVELDFQRFPTLVPATTAESLESRTAKINAFVQRVRTFLDELGTQRGRPLILSARVPSEYGLGTPTYAQARARGCDPAVWARAGWIQFLAISEWLFTAPSLDLAAWRSAVPGIPLYAGIQPESQPSPSEARCEFCLGAEGYRRSARERWQDGADGIYLFNFFTTREWELPFEPPFEVLSQIGARTTLEALLRGPWETNRPLATVRREVYRAHPRPRAAAMTAVHSVGPSLELREWQATESRDDVADEQRARWSLDHGRTWSEWRPQSPSSLVRYGATEVWEGGWADHHDPASGRLVQLWLRQIQTNQLYHCFTYVRTSPDLGRTWSTPEPLRYEPSPDFDPAQPAASEFLNRNEGYPGNNLATLPDGTLVTALAHANAPGDTRNDQRPWRMGSVLFLGRWNPTTSAYSWTPGARTEIRPDQSARGLMEPEVAALRDGRLLVVWRGSDTGWDGTTASEPGRKWFALSADSGRSLTPVRAWTYADGTPFFSPSSIHRMFRHSVTGKLYWIGNITPTPPRGNSPRFPLVLAEVDEAAAALRRETVTVVADRLAYQGPQVQFSNFSLYEDRETHAVILHLTTYGQEPDPQDWATADSLRLSIRLTP
ncbi:MAG: hypothetical protein IT580_01735 [Verrucomicrobiales bacterium]|nr:hypothetical protein [Verrucomicrobiales bacterium]